MNMPFKANGYFSRQSTKLDVLIMEIKVVSHCLT